MQFAFSSLPYSSRYVALNCLNFPSSVGCKYSQDPLNAGSLPAPQSYDTVMTMDGISARQQMQCRMQVKSTRVPLYFAVRSAGQSSCISRHYPNAATHFSTIPFVQLPVRQNALSERLAFSIFSDTNQRSVFPSRTSVDQAVIAPPRKTHSWVR